MQQFIRLLKEAGIIIIAVAIIPLIICVYPLAIGWYRVEIEVEAWESEFYVKASIWHNSNIVGSKIIDNVKLQDVQSTKQNISRWADTAIEQIKFLNSQ